MTHPVILFADTKTEWARVMRSTIQKHYPFSMTSSLTRLRRIIRSIPSRKIVIIDTKQVSSVSNIIDEIKTVDQNAVILIATSSEYWEDTVAYIKSGAANILYKTIDSDQIIASLRKLDVKPM